MATTENIRPLLRPIDVAELLNVSRKTAYRLIERGELDAVHVGASVRVRPDDLEREQEPGHARAGFRRRLDRRALAGVGLGHPPRW